MKKINIMIWILGLVLLGCNDTKKEEPKKATNVCGIDCEPANMDEYEGFDNKDNIFLSITFEEANTFLKDDSFSGIIYFGYATCPWCIEAVPIMNEVAKANDMQIYYVDKKATANEEHPEWEQETTKLLDDAYGLEVDDDGNPRLYVPEVIVVENGEVIDHNMGTLEEHDATERKMTSDEQKQLKAIYEEMFGKLK